MIAWTFPLASTAGREIGARMAKRVGGPHRPDAARAGTRQPAVELTEGARPVDDAADIDTFGEAQPVLRRLFGGRSDRDRVARTSSRLATPSLVNATSSWPTGAGLELTVSQPGGG